MGGVLYLEVPNELTRGMLEQRVRLPLLAALENIEDSDISSFAIVVNPEIQSDVLQIPADEGLMPYYPPDTSYAETVLT